MIGSTLSRYPITADELHEFTFWFYADNVSQDLANKDHTCCDKAGTDVIPFELNASTIETSFSNQKMQAE